MIILATMQRRMIKHVPAMAFAAALTLAAIIALASSALASDIMLLDAYARASASPKVTSGAAYVTIMNNGGTADVLRSVAADVARVAEVHEMKEAEGVMTMRATGPLEIPANTSVTMGEMGYHIMLMGLKQPLVKDQAFSLVLTFEKAGAIPVTVTVGDVAASGNSQGSMTTQ
jgi:copper(I)-binding protein